MVLSLLGLVTYNFIRNVRDPPHGEWRLIRTHIDAYLLSLLASETLQGLGATMNAKWILEGALYCSSYCSVQGALKTIGESGVAMSTTVSYRDRLRIVLYSFPVILSCYIDSCGLPGSRHPHLRCRFLSLDTRSTISLDLSYCNHLDMDLPSTFCHYCRLRIPP